MLSKRHLALAALQGALALTGYFSAYLLTADYTDVGDNTPLYLIRYHLGTLPLHPLAPLFEPARRLDDLCLRRRHAFLLE